MRKVIRPKHLGLLAAAAALLCASCAGGGGGGARGGASGGDLVAIGVSGTPSGTVDHGAPLHLSIRVDFGNDGPRIRRPFRIGLYLSTDGTIDPLADPLIAAVGVPGIRAGEVDHAEFDVTISPPLPGTYEVGVYLDDDPAPTGAVRERSESNNGAVDPIQLVVVAPPPDPPTRLFGEDLARSGAGQWYVDGPILLEWDAVPNVAGYNLYVSDRPLGPTNPGTKVNLQGPIPGPALGPGFGIGAYIDGSPLSTPWATPIPSNGEPNRPAGTYYYRVRSVDGLGQESVSGPPPIIAKHLDAGSVFVGFSGGSPGGLFTPEPVANASPDFGWTGPSAPAEWSFSIAEDFSGTDPSWMYFGFSPGLAAVGLRYGAVGAFTILDAVPLESGRTYAWFAVGYDSDGWASLRSQPLLIAIP